MTTTTQARTFIVRPIPAEVLDAVRTDGVDVSGHPVEHRTSTGGEPLRCCLRNAEPAEAIILFGYEPPLPASLYREIGPVFAHAEPCPGPEDDGYPSQWSDRTQVFRAYDAQGRIHDASRVHEGNTPETPEATLAAMLADPDVVQIHSRNVVYGCYMLRITRPT
ncbi:DUF1203 domain-containing protein [Embleya sp. NBC_00896]|uniref:DUF1203 domain-containing protein n=1 Tax=Embleya sp. NBC_00896 TaxID=2975961 RepID=UPI002F90FD58|nr:DUF1203 domain-containing protein [Embleya sp. NBC_00896]